MSGISPAPFGGGGGVGQTRSDLGHELGHLGFGLRQLRQNLLADVEVGRQSPVGQHDLGCPHVAGSTGPPQASSRSKLRVIPEARLGGLT